MSAFSLEFSNRASRAGAALLVALAIVLGPYAACAEQPSVRPGFSLQAFCADPEGKFSQLRTALRPRIGLPSTDRRYEEIESGVLLRLARDCRNLASGKRKSANVNLDLYVRNSRIDAWRLDKRLEFQDELIELVPAESDATAQDILDVIQKRASTRQQVVFGMLAQGMSTQEIADHIGRKIGTIYAEQQKIETLLRTELQLRVRTAPAPRRLNLRLKLAGTAQAPATAPAATITSDEPSMVRVQSQLGGEIAAALKSGAEVMPTGSGHAGPVMTVKIPRSQLFGAPVDGIVMLPVPIILQSNTAGEQEMVAAAAREIGDEDGDTRTFALYAFCKDEHLETPADLSRYSFKSEVSDSKMVDIVTRSDLRQPDKISERLWALSTGG